jgi:hypothetical protein
VQRRLNEVRLKSTGETKPAPENKKTTIARSKAGTEERQKKKVSIVILNSEVKNFYRKLPSPSVFPTFYA